MRVLDDDNFDERIRATIYTSVQYIQISCCEYERIKKNRVKEKDKKTKDPKYKASCVLHVLKLLEQLLKQYIRVQ
jgi:hypothetical protein